MSTWEIGVRGLCPVPWESNEWTWRRLIADHERQANLSSNLPSNYLQGHFTVNIIFFMTMAQLNRADLDNLAKPVLDTLFLNRNAQVTDTYLTGALFHVDDDRVFELNLKKCLVASYEDEGVDIHVMWHEND